MNLTPRKQNNVTKSGSLFPELSSFRSEIDNLFDQFFRGSALSPRGAMAWAPNIDVKDNEKEILIKCELPGVDPKDVDLSLKGDVLTIKGQKNSERTEDTDQYYVTERRFGSFLRAIELPDSVDTDSIKAEQRDGVLSIQLKKRPDSAQKKIPVASGK